MPVSPVTRDGGVRVHRDQPVVRTIMVTQRDLLKYRDREAQAEEPAGLPQGAALSKEKSRGPEKSALLGSGPTSALRMAGTRPPRLCHSR